MPSTPKPPIAPKGVKPGATLTADRLAAIIREVDGGHSLGAAALAEAILGHPGIGEALPRPLPPRPPVEQIESDLVRYGVCWEGIPANPLLVPMEDGYWTPWHIAAKRCATTTSAPVQPPTASEIQWWVTHWWELYGKGYLPHSSDVQLVRDALARWGTAPNPITAAAPTPERGGSLVEVVAEALRVNESLINVCRTYILRESDARAAIAAVAGKLRWQGDVRAYAGYIEAAAWLEREAGR
jgi:hypothetical protein